MYIANKKAMEKEKALEILDVWLGNAYSFPKLDTTIRYIRMKNMDELDFSFTYDEDEGTVCEEYTFRHLLCIAYDLETKK